MREQVVGRQYQAQQDANEKGKPYRVATKNCVNFVFHECVAQLVAAAVPGDHGGQAAEPVGLAVVVAAAFRVVLVVVGRGGSTSTCNKLAR